MKSGRIFYISLLYHLLAILFLGGGGHSVLICRNSLQKKVAHANIYTSGEGVKVSIHIVNARSIYFQKSFIASQWIRTHQFSLKMLLLILFFDYILQVWSTCSLMA